MKRTPIVEEEFVPGGGRFERLSVVVGEEADGRGSCSACSEWIEVGEPAIQDNDQEYMPTFCKRCIEKMAAGVLWRVK